MSRKSRKQRQRKRTKMEMMGAAPKSNLDSELLLKKQNNNEARKLALKYLESW